MIYIFMFSIFVLCASRSPFPDRIDNNFQEECLRAHNDYRARHNVPPLQLDNKAIAYAKARCNTVSRFEGLSNGRKGLFGYGENIYWGTDSKSNLRSGKVAVKSWYDELSKYRYTNPGFSPQTDHFTQMVWKSSRYVGCARCGGKGSKWYETYVVCDYRPSGNVLNQYRQNVLHHK